VALAGLAPQAEFGAQAEVLQRRVEDGRLGASNGASRSRKRVTLSSS
jgi:hypothetical protein